MNAIKKILPLLIQLPLAALLLFLCSCGKDERTAKEPEILQVCGVKFGAVHDPRNGEGRLLDITHPRIDIPGFTKVSVEVTPFEHKVWRIVLIAPEISGADPLRTAAAAIGGHCGISFSADGETMLADLPRQKVILRRRLDWGPQACEAEFICKKRAEIALTAKKSPRFIEAQRRQKAFNDLVILQDLAAAYQQRHSKLPASVEALQSLSGNVPLPVVDPWGKPYRLEIKGGKVFITASHPVE